MIALFAGLSGAAWATGARDSSSRGGLRSLQRKLAQLQQQVNNLSRQPGPQGAQGVPGAPGQPGADGVSFQYGEVLTEESLPDSTPSSFVDLTTPGPSVTVTVPAGHPLVEIFA